MPEAFDAIVLGGGAAGLYAAIVAGRRARRVLVLEHMREVGKKILISGGGRCNFTNTHTTPEDFATSNPDFPRSALSRYPPSRFIAEVESHAIAYHEKKAGQLFCDSSARQIVGMLVAECKGGGVDVRTSCSIRSVARDTRFVVETSQGDFHAPGLVVATGGLSIPPIGATDLGYRIAARFSIPVVPTRPGLTPFLLSPADRERVGSLAGVSAPCVVEVRGRSFREAMLFTHRGLSGPAMLEASSHWAGGEALTLDLLPDLDAGELLKDARAAGARSASSLLASRLPRRLAEAWSEGRDPRPLSQWSDAEIALLKESLHAWRVIPSGTEGYAKAEVTVGGVATEALSSRTMEAQTVPGLFFVGEVVDVTGRLGGYNFQWAWASAHAAGLAL